MKKLIQKIKNYFNAKDLDKYDDLPLEEQYYRMRIENIKSAERTSRYFLFFALILAITFSIALIIAGVSGGFDTEVTASAAEENVYVQPNTDTQWYNYTMYFDVLSVPFLALTDDILANSEDYYVGSTEFGVFFPLSFYFADSSGNVIYQGSALLYEGTVSSYSAEYESGIEHVEFALGNYTATSRYYVDSIGNSYSWYYLDLITVDDGLNIAFSSDYFIDLASLRLYVTPTVLDHQRGNDEVQTPFSRPWFELSRSDDYLTYNVGTWSLGENGYVVSSLPFYSVVSNTGTAYNSGYSTGFDVGFDRGFDSGFDSGYSSGSSTGFDNGFDVGFERGEIVGAANANDYSFMSLISAVFDAPIALIVGNMEDTNGDGIADSRVGGLLNFDFLGINVSSFLLAIFTVCVIIALVKMFISR